MAHPLELEEPAGHFTLYPDETRLLRNKSGATRLGFSLSLKFPLWKARFLRGRGELPDNMIEFVAGQVGVPAADIGFYDWDGRQVKRHRAEIRRVTGFRECSPGPRGTARAVPGGEDRAAGRDPDRPDHRLGAAAGRRYPHGADQRPDPAGRPEADGGADRRGQ